MLTAKGKLSLFLGLLSMLAVASIAPGTADVDKRWDWPGKKRNLKVCVQSTAGCPANFADSVQAAINTWNADLTSWSLTYTTDCSTADIKISCGNISGLGEWRASYNSGTKEATNHRIKVKSGAAWGWCDDKYEVVSTLMHELGHAMRLDHTHAGDQMRSAQGKTGHQRGISAKDSTEAAISDTSATAGAGTNPPGGRRQTTYMGVFEALPGEPSLDLFNTTTIDVVPYHPTMVQIQSFNVLNNEQLEWTADLAAGADGTEPVRIVLERPGPVTDVVWAYLHVVDLTWNDAWAPVAVAPPDTNVGGPTDPIILYTTLSTHGGGFDKMDFTWIIDGGEILKGEDVSSVTLAAGVHQIALIAVDEFGKESVDNMLVSVGSGGIPTITPMGIAILLLLLLLLSIFILKRRTAAGMFASLLRVIAGR